MRYLLTMLCYAMTTAALAQDAPAKPHTWALVSAIGSNFSMVTEIVSTGTTLEPYQRNNLTMKDDTLNRLVLSDLDDQVQAMDPDSKRVFLSMPALKLPPGEPSRYEQVSIDAVTKALTSQAGRSEWDRIIVVTPAYRALDKDGLSGKLQGIGLFVEPICKSDPDSCEYNRRPVSGPQAMRPDGSVEAANTFVAPFTFITVWELDPATLAVLSKRQIFSHQKLMGEDGKTDRLLDNMDKHKMAGQMVKLIGVSIHDALKQARLTGHVEVRVVDEEPPAVQ